MTRQKNNYILKKRINSNGFTLIELLVAMAIFSAVILMAVDVFLTGLGGTERVFGLQATQESGRFVLESTVKEIRMSRVNSFDGAAYDSLPDGDSGPYASLSITNADNQVVDYVFDNVSQRISRNGSVLTSNNVMATGGFYLTKSSDQQPRVTVVMRLQNQTDQEKNRVTINLQNTVSSRQYTQELALISTPTPSPCVPVVDGGWSDWGSWGVCSVSCGGGTQTAYRTCSNPLPSCGGSPCVDLNYKTQSCNTQPCPISAFGGTITYTDSNGLNPRSSSPYTGGYKVHTFTGVAFPDSETAPKTVTTNGNAQTSATQSKFGGASAYFDGSGDYLSLANSADWAFGSGDFTIDYWFYQDALGTYQTHLKFFDNTNGRAWMTYTHAQGLYFQWNNEGEVFTGPSYVNLGAWNHAAFVRNGNNLKIYLNGVARYNNDFNYTINASTEPLLIGYPLNGGNYFNGYIDELRVSKGIARWTEDFTPPTSAYSADANTNLLLHADSSTIFTVTGSGNVDALVVAGGGGGGGNIGGAGGAGGLKYSASMAVTDGNISVSVGGGGSGGNSWGTNGTNGGGSAFGALSVSGGGGGSGPYPGYEAQIGGSGGGGSGWHAQTGANGIAGEGNRGGDGGAYESGDRGGGGGATGAGGVMSCGAGYTSSISGTSVTYATGCGAGVNTGNGGSWSGSGASGDNGGSGIVIVRYKSP